MTPAKPAAPKQSWTDVFAAEMVAIGGRLPDVVAITAAMLHPVGLAPFKQAYPDRVYDVGIAEQHAMTMAAGLAMAGLHPVVSVYATFLNRAFDQLLMDVALHRLPVTVTLDRAGVTGPDGARHNGMWDGSILQVVPGPAGRRPARRQPGRRAAQRGRRRQRRPHRRPLAQGHRRRRGRGGRQARPDGRPGRARPRSSARTCCCSAPGRWPSPASRSRAGWPTTASASRSSTRAGSSRSTRPSSAAARQHRLVAVVEDNGRAGGFGDAVARLLRDHDVDVPVKTFGLAQEFLDHGTRDADPRGGRADPAAPRAPAHRGGRPPHPGGGLREAVPAGPPRPRLRESSTPERLPE